MAQTPRPGLLPAIQQSPLYEAIFGRMPDMSIQFPDYTPPDYWFQSYAPTAMVGPEAFQRSFEMLPPGLSQAYATDIEQMESLNRMNEEWFNKWNQFMNQQFDAARNVYSGMSGKAF